MRTLAVLNQKGGVGKTTTAVNIAAAFARMKKRVLLIDLDPQAHATLHVGVDPGPTDPTVFDLFVNRTPVAEIARNVNDRLSLIPSSVDLVGAELQIADREDRERILSRALEPFRDAFDLCVLDCPPSLGLIAINALVLASEVLIPLQPHFLALQGLSRLLETVTAVRESLNPALRVSGVVLSLYERGTRLSQEVQADVSTFFGAAAATDAWFGARVFDSAIRRNIKLAECPSFGKTIFDYAPDSHGAADYAALAKELLRAKRPEDPPPPAVAASSDAVIVAPDTAPFDRTVPEGIVTAVSPHALPPVRHDALPDGL